MQRLCDCYHDKIDEAEKTETDTKSGELRGRGGGALLCFLER